MAATRVFDTTELLESILLELPFKNIAFTAPLVSKQWKAVVDNSASLQKATFRIADGDPILPIAASRVDELESGHLSPILQSHPARILQLFEDPTPHCREGPFGDDIDTSVTETLPRSWRYKYYDFTDPVSGHHGFSWFNENLDHQSAIRLPSVARSMYLTQPPFTACKLRIYLHSGGYLWEILYDKSGMRLGHIADAVAQLLHQCDQFGQKIEEGRCERPEKINRIMVSFRAEVEGEEQNGD